MQVSYFTFTGSHNVKVLMWESSNVNFIIQMWLKIQFSPFLVLKLSDYMKIGETIMVQVLGLVENERINNLAFMKSKLYN
jgi:hypothetical protein